MLWRTSWVRYTIVLLFIGFLWNISLSIKVLSFTDNVPVVHTTDLITVDRQYSVTRSREDNYILPSSDRMTITNTIFDKCRGCRTNVITISNICPTVHDGSTLDHENFYDDKLLLLKDILAPYESSIEYNSDILFQNNTVVIIPNALCFNDKSVRSSDITVVTQMNLSKIKRLDILTQRWNGPASVAIKITSIQELERFFLLLQDHDNLIERVAFHIFYENEALYYPHNDLRNLGMEHVKSDYFALFDVDLFPSPINTHDHIRDMMDRHPYLEDKLKNEKKFLILPAFETMKEISDQNISLEHPTYPETKEMALEMSLNNERLRMFYQTYPPAQTSTDYDQWKSNSTDITYSITNKVDFGYEPYIIGATKDIPKFYRSFRGFGLNKSSFYVETHYAGYRFEVLRDFFIFHVMHPKIPHKEKQEQHKMNRVCVKEFVKYLGVKYGAGSKGVYEVGGWNRWTQMK